MVFVSVNFINWDPLAFCLSLGNLTSPQVIQSYQSMTIWSIPVALFFFILISGVLTSVFPCFCTLLVYLLCCQKRASPCIQFSLFFLCIVLLPYFIHFLPCNLFYFSHMPVPSVFSSFSSCAHYSLSHSYFAYLYLFLFFYLGYSSPFLGICCLSLGWELSMIHICS